MNKRKLIPISSVLMMFLIAAAAEQTLAQPVSSPLSEQGKQLVEQGDKLIREGQIMKETGLKMIQQSGDQPVAAPSVQTSPPASTSTVQQPTPASPSTDKKPGMLDPSELLKNTDQYQKYLEQGQELLKKVK